MKVIERKKELYMKDIFEGNKNLSNRERKRDSYRESEKRRNNKFSLEENSFPCTTQLNLPKSRCASSRVE